MADLKAMATATAPREFELSYSTTIEEVFEKLKESGHSKTQCKLYKDDRHEILNELDRELVYDDVIAFCNSVIK